MIQAIHLFNDKQTKKKQWMNDVNFLELYLGNFEFMHWWWSTKKNIVSVFLFTHTLRRHTHTGSNLF